jgi:hypothetical protein
MNLLPSLESRVEMYRRSARRLGGRRIVREPQGRRAATEERRAVPLERQRMGAVMSPTDTFAIAGASRRAAVRSCGALHRLRQS